MAYDNNEGALNSGRLAGHLGTAERHYLLGAELAQAAEYERAVAEMTRALQLQPNLHTARLQLGLLYLTLGQPAQSLATWQPLDALDPQAYLRLFKEGLEALIRDDFVRCVALLEAGIRANTQNAPLNQDMGRLISKARAATSQRKPAQPPAPGGADEVRSDFSLYDQ